MEESVFYKKAPILFFRSFFLQSLWNFERMQNIGFVYVLLPFFKTLYPDKGKRKEILLRHLDFFNTNPYVVNIIFGLVAALEEDVCNGKANGYERITAIKANVAGPLAAIGDKFFWATWRPFVALLSVGLVLFPENNMASYGLWVPVIIFVGLYNLFLIPFRYWSLNVSYLYKDSLINFLSNINIKKAVNLARYISIVFVFLMVSIYLHKFHLNVELLLMLSFIFILTVVLVGYRISSEIIIYIVSGISIMSIWFKHILF